MPQDISCKSHANHKVKTYSKYTKDKVKEKEIKSHHIENNHITKEGNKRGRNDKNIFEQLEDN